MNAGPWRRPRALLLVSVVLILGLGLLAWWQREAHQPAPANGTAPAADSAQATAAAAVQPGTPLSAAKASRAAEQPAEPRSITLDICGIGRMPVSLQAGNGAQDVLPDHLMKDPLDHARAQMLQALAQGSERMRAVGLALQGLDARAALRQLATNSEDPAVLRWAVASCTAADQDCPGPLAQRWARVEPDNVAALMQALPAQGVLAIEHLRPLAAARRDVLHWGVLVAEVAKAPPADMAPYLRQALVMEAVAADAALASRPLGQVTSYCRAQAPAGGEPQALCAHLAELLVMHSDTLLANRIGLRMGERAGWPKSRVAELRSESEAATASMSPMLALSGQPLACAAVQQTLAWAQDLGRLGEMGLLRRNLAASAPR